MVTTMAVSAPFPDHCGSIPAGLRAASMEHTDSGHFKKRLDCSFREESHLHLLPSTDKWQLHSSPASHSCTQALQGTAQGKWGVWELLEKLLFKGEVRGHVFAELQRELLPVSATRVGAHSPGCPSFFTAGTLHQKGDAGAGWFTPGDMHCGNLPTPS